MLQGGEGGFLQGLGSVLLLALLNEKEGRCYEGEECGGERSVEWKAFAAGVEVGGFDLVLQLAGDLGSGFCGLSFERF